MRRLVRGSSEAAFVPFGIGVESGEVLAALLVARGTVRAVGVRGHVPRDRSSADEREADELSEVSLVRECVGGDRGGFYLNFGGNVPAFAVTESLRPRACHVCCGGCLDVYRDVTCVVKMIFSSICSRGFQGNVWTSAAK